MAKNKEENMVMEEAWVAMPIDPPRPVVVTPERVRTLSFHQWASRRGIKRQHMSGIQAFIKDYSRDRSMEDWDKAVVGY